MSDCQLVYEDWEIGPAWFTLSGYSDEPLRLTADKLSNLLSQWTANLRTFRAAIKD